MSVMLLQNAGADVTGAAAPVRGLDGRIGAYGSGTDGAWEGDAVIIEYSLSSEQNDWAEFGTIAITPGADLTLDFPVERIRARTEDMDNDTTVSVYFAPSPVSTV